MPAGMTNQDRTRNRGIVCVLLGATIFLGLASRRFAESLPELVVTHAGDCLWTVACYLSVCLLAPKWPAGRVLGISIGLSFAVEFSQLIDWPPLQQLRRTLPGRLLLGTGFLWADLGRYTVGGLLAYALDSSQLWRRKTQHPLPEDTP